MSTTSETVLDDDKEEEKKPAPIVKLANGVNADIMRNCLKILTEKERETLTR